MNALLSVKNSSIRFGGLSALSNVSFEMAAGEMLAIIGPNGAGKSTLFNLLTGIYQPTEGDISFKGATLGSRSLGEINRLGVARTFQNIRLFSQLTVYENVAIAQIPRYQTGFVRQMLGTLEARKEHEAMTEKAMQLLTRFALQGRADELASNLSYGEQRRLEIARALATEPKLLLLDEPAAGMNASEKKDLIELIQKVRADFDLAVIFIEHDMKMVMTLAPRILVLDYGVTIAEGTPDEIRKNPKVIEAYLGEAP